MKDNYFIVLFWICIFWVCLVVIIVKINSLSNQIDTLNDNTELLINRTDTILTILQD